jgi:nicotinamidase-related amidase
MIIWQTLASLWIIENIILMIAIFIIKRKTRKLILREKRKKKMKVLVVVDMQKDFVDGSLGTKEAQAIVPAVTKKVNEYAKMKNTVIIYTRDTHYEDYMETREGQILPVPHCIFGTEGWEIVPEVINLDATIAVLDKKTFGKSDIADNIMEMVGKLTGSVNIESIELCGLCTDICVVSNALILKANFPETAISVDSECCAGVTPEKHEAALEVMRSCQITVL